MAIMSFLESKDEVMAAVRFFSSLEFAEMRECFKSAQVNFVMVDVLFYFHLASLPRLVSDLFQTI